MDPLQRPHQRRLADARLARHEDELAAPVARLLHDRLQGRQLLAALQRERLGERAAFLVGVCEPLSVPVPLAPWHELVAAEDPMAPAGDALAFARSVLGVL